MKVVSCNIEGNKHLQERVIPFLQQEQADVICLQEVFYADVPLLETALEATAYFSLTVRVSKGLPSFPQPHGLLGQVILTRHTVAKVRHTYYAPDRLKDDLNELLVPRLKEDDFALEAAFSRGSVEIPFEVPELTHPTSPWRVLSSIEVEVDGAWYRIANTHFTWADNGSFSRQQERDFAALQSVLAELGEVIICGDFNSPRGRSADLEPGELNVYDSLAEQMESCVPDDVTTTLDANLHRVPNLDLVVDGIFITPTYQLDQIQIVDGVSDHKALVAAVSKLL